MRCFYCMPAKPVTKLAHSEILRFEECIEIVRIAASLGITKVRITGGEPLVRRGVVGLVQEIASCPGVETTGLTTNGSMLAELAKPLKEAGLERINVSLDSLDQEVYQRITGRGELNAALKGIDQALELGFRVKINTVLLPGLNLNELDRLIGFALERKCEIRFIERMSFKDDDPYFTQDEAIALLRRNHRVEPIEESESSPHVRLFDCDGAGIGFISPRSRPFCSGCNKLRLTPHGQMRACLASNVHVDMRAIVRRPHTDDDMRRAIRTATSLKPIAGPWNAEAEMWRVGG
jgi:cyclic pyranopterin phosphate synthase